MLRRTCFCVVQICCARLLLRGLLTSTVFFVLIPRVDWFARTVSALRSAWPAVWRPVQAGPAETGGSANVVTLSSLFRVDGLFHEIVACDMQEFADITTHTKRPSNLSPTHIRLFVRVKSRPAISRRRKVKACGGTFLLLPYHY